MKKLYKNILAILVIGFTITGCNTEYLDPNSTLEPEVVASTDNLIRLINGVQKRWSTERSGIVYNATHISSLNTNELRLLNPGNLGENDILNGGSNVNGANELLVNIWVNAMLCRKEATTVINSADIASSEALITNSLKAYGLFYRALAHGTLIQFFEQIPLDIIDNAPFKTRQEVLQNVIEDLTMAQSLIANGVANQVSTGVIDSIALENAIPALLARFYLMAGLYAEAISAVNMVDFSVKSTWQFDSANPNPLAFWFGSQNVTQAKDDKFGLPEQMLPDPNDKRIAFYVLNEGDNNAPNFQIQAFYDTNLDEIPLYLPGELMLIKAEAYARQNNLSQAITALNSVLTKTGNNDAYGIGAELPEYAGIETQQAILNEIYKNRKIELYLMGLSLEDNRRFGRPGPGETNPERNKTYYPYPNAERDNNSNTPSNPEN